MHKAGNLLYQYLLGVIYQYQKNYKGKDKMSMCDMLEEIKRFKK